MRLNACVEDLNAMTPNDSGRYCGSCNKNIVDLTEKSNEEIQQLYIENNGELCGIVLPNQLEERKYYHPLKRFAFSLMLVFGSALFVFGGDIQPHFDSFRVKVLTEVAEIETAHTIKGFVFANGNSFSGAEVSVVSGDHIYKARTDADGLFILELPDLNLEEVELTVYADGFATGYKYVTLSSSSVYIGKITLSKEKIKDVKMGKIAPNYKRTQGMVMPSPPKPPLQDNVAPLQGEVEPLPAGGIKPPTNDSIFD